MPVMNKRTQNYLNKAQEKMMESRAGAVRVSELGWIHATENRDGMGGDIGDRQEAACWFYSKLFLREGVAL
jgi:hypothetical protein